MEYNRDVKRHAIDAYSKYRTSVHEYTLKNQVSFELIDTGVLGNISSGIWSSSGGDRTKFREGMETFCRDLFDLVTYHRKQGFSKNHHLYAISPIAVCKVCVFNKTYVGSQSVTEMISENTFWLYPLNDKANLLVELDSIAKM